MSGRVSLRHIRCFVAVAKYRSFTLAAHRLFITQSTLTTTIRQFEESIGVRLFERTTRSLELTNEGARFLGRAEGLVNDFNSAIDDLKLIAKGEAGEIRLAAAPSISNILVSKAIADFRQLNPNVSFLVREGGAEQIEMLVQQGAVDMGFAENYSNLDELRYRPLLKDEIGIVFRKEDAQMYQEIKTWAQLPEKNYIAFTPDTGVSSLLENLTERQTLRNVAIRVSCSSALFSVLEKIGGYSIVPYLSARHGGGDNVEFLKLAEPVLARDICLITKTSDTKSPLAEIFVERVRRVLMTQREELLGGVKIESEWIGNAQD